MRTKIIIPIIFCLTVTLHASAQQNIFNPLSKWIESGAQDDSVNRPATYFTKNFTINNKVLKAKILITAHGMYEAYINGHRIGNDLFTPGWTSYKKRLQYQEYDLSALMGKAANVLQVTVGDGWWRSPLGTGNVPDTYGKKTGLLLQLELTYADGKKQLITSDESWTWTDGPIRMSEIYNGEYLDSRIALKNTRPVIVANYPMDNLVPTLNEPVRAQETYVGKKLIRTPKGEQVIDFGQNLAGWVRFRIQGRAGDTLRIDHAEVLDRAGNFYTQNLRKAKAQDVYILNGTEQVLEPHFTWHGFRYIRVSGVRGDINPGDFTAVAVYSNLPKTGSFECSDPLLNQLQHNIVWSQNSNFIDVPTDCPQRDERQGWAGDAMVFSRTAAFNWDVRLFFSKWLKDLAADQLPDGSVPWVIPSLGNDLYGSSAGWSDAATIVPWTMYQVYGGKQVLADQYASMKAYIDYIRQVSRADLWNSGFQWGDWLSFRSEGLFDYSALTNRSLIAQCFYIYSTQLLVNTAEVLGKQQDVIAYTALLKRIKEAFVNEYMTPNGRLMSDTQTAYVLALAFDVLPEDRRATAARWLVDNIKSYDDHITTGFLGASYICHVLSRFGYHDVAYKLLMQQDYPSWLYPVKMGATTIWERWDGINPDGTFQTPEMNSFNQYAYGAIGDWIYQHILGIQIGEPGYKKVIIKPVIGGGLTWAKGSYQSVNGRIAISWKLEEKEVVLDVEIPQNVTAEVHVPGIPGTKTVEAGAHHFKGRITS